MSFGYGVGDFIAIGALAWNIYKSCKGAPESFGNISFEVLSLHAVLKEAEETVFARPLSPTKQEYLKSSWRWVLPCLERLGQSLQEIPGSGDTGKRTWDRMRWGTEEVAE